MAMNPRTRRGRPKPHRNGFGPRPLSTNDPRRRRSTDPTRRPAPTPIQASLPGSVDPTMAATLGSVLDAFTESWERGERPRAEGYFGLVTLEDSAELIYHEYCLAEASDLAPDQADYLRRFPQQAEPLGRLFGLHGAISEATLRAWAEVDSDELPSIGDEIGPYRLLRELGRGSFARVFLAEQADLDHRLVVLKVSTRSTAEPQLLARVRHPHIVEVLRHAVTDDGAFHLVCMPFLGGATLAAVLEERRRIDRGPRSGLELLADFDRVAAPEYPSARMDSPAREILAGLSYAKALAWIVARLAEALDHAHGRGVAHGDLKPSNVLLTAEGVPMLFDFNLSVDWRSDEPDASTADLGGTLAYMAPERLRAIAEGGGGRAPKADGLHRADLYALGLVLLELLTGRTPEAPQPRPNNARELAGVLARLRQTVPTSLRSGDRPIPSALWSILTHCLAPDPADRYARGQELAEDLDRWRLDRPLAFVDESRRSTLTRTARRRRSGLIGVGLTLASAVAVAFFASLMLAGTKSHQALAKYSMIVDRADPGVFGFRRFGHWRGDERGEPVGAAARQLALYDVLADPNWRNRDDIQFLPDRERGELEVWLFEQILRYAVALEQRPDSPNDWRRGLELLELTLHRVASSTLQTERAALRAKLDRADPGPDPADLPQLPRWMDDYLAGVLAEPLHAREALGHYRDALRDRPDLFWAHYRAAVVACRIDEYPIAADDLRACVRRSPENPSLHLQLASILYKVEQSTIGGQRFGEIADALSECDRALAIDPDYTLAYNFRARIRQPSRQVESVQADVDRFALLSRLQGLAPALRLRLGLGLHPGPNYKIRADAEGMAKQTLDNDLDNYDNRAIQAAVLSMQGRTAEALFEYDRVLEADPEHLRARYQRALQLKRLDPARAIVEYAALIEHPRFEELFREEPEAIRLFHHVSTDLMKRGKVAEGLKVADRALSLIALSRPLSDKTILARRKAGSQLNLWPRGETLYLMARLHAVAGRKDRGELDQVVDRLDQAFAINPKFRDGWFANDRLFDEWRGEILERIPPVAAVR
jgi:eukaryotic-like serine/threonine-protein kinase